LIIDIFRQAPVDDSVLQAIESPPPAASSTPSTAAPVVDEPDNGQWPGDGQGVNFINTLLEPFS